MIEGLGYAKTACWEIGHFVYSTIQSLGI